MDGCDPPGQKPFRFSAPEATHISKQLTVLTDMGLVRPSMSGFEAPILLVIKKKATFRMCIHYRWFNLVKKKDSFPLPLIKDLIDKLTGAHVISNIDFKSGFHHVKKKPSQYWSHYVCDAIVSVHFFGDANGLRERSGYVLKTRAAHSRSPCLCRDLLCTTLLLLARPCKSVRSPGSSPGGSTPNCN